MIGASLQESLIRTQNLLQNELNFHQLAILRKECINRIKSVFSNSKEEQAVINHLCIHRANIILSQHSRSILSSCHRLQNSYNDVKKQMIVESFGERPAFSMLTRKSSINK